MTRLLLALALPAVALAVAACGGGSSSETAATSNNSSSTSNQASGAATVDLAKTDLGKVLASSGGRTLYLFERDKGSKSTCFGACAAAWPPLTTSGKPKAGNGVSAAKLSSSSRGGGVSEVTYNGHPLYLYAGDSARGQTNGQGLDQFGAEWYVLSASGNKIDREG
jgi:predicted lipoprotein with Yx(FWY)xxD motif